MGMIVITTMDLLPEHCFECPCHDGESGYCQADASHRYSDYRPHWCPLKEQEAVEPYVTGNGESFETAENWWYECGNCNKPIDPTDKFCRHCGRAVKWDA